MKVGELFLDIGIKGSDKALSVLKSVKNALTDMSAPGIAAKAAIVGAVYALERFTISSAQLGTGLRQFANFTGMSTDMLQKWQSAMLQTGVSAEETESNIIAVQTAMGKMINFGQQPEGMALLASRVNFDYTKAKNTPYVLEKLREYLQKEKNVTQANVVAESFGLTYGAIAGLRAFKGDVKNQSGGISDNTVDRLNRINGAWNRLWWNIKIAKANLVGDFGLPFIQFLQNGVVWVENLIKKLSKLMKESAGFKNFFAKGGTMDRLENAFEHAFDKGGFMDKFSDLVGRLVSLLDRLLPSSNTNTEPYGPPLPPEIERDEKYRNAPSGSDIWKSIFNVIKNADETFSVPNSDGKVNSLWMLDKIKSLYEHIAPTPKSAPTGGSITNQKTSMNVINNNYGDFTPEDFLNDQRSMVNAAVRQMALGRVV